MTDLNIIKNIFNNKNLAIPNLYFCQTYDNKKINDEIINFKVLDINHDKYNNLLEKNINKIKNTKKKTKRNIKKKNKKTKKNKKLY